jgi:hypothetical protein
MVECCPSKRDVFSKLSELMESFDVYCDFSAAQPRGTPRASVEHRVSAWILP